MRVPAAVAAIVVIGAVLAGCGDDDSSESGGSATAEEATGAEGDGAAGTGGEGGTAEERGRPGEVIDVRESEFGPIVVDAGDRTLYLFDKEASDTSECYGACADAWPPFLTRGDPRAGKGVEKGLLGTTKRDDGTTQVTYDGHPLYYYVDDPAGEVLCHNVEEFGGLWLVVAPDGNAVQ